jgi:hypothetical protein
MADKKDCRVNFNEGFVMFTRQVKSLPYSHRF